MRFAYAEVKRAVLEIVKNFEISLHDTTASELTLGSVSVVHLSIPQSIFLEFKQII